MLSRTPKQNGISFFTVAVWAVCIVLTLGSIPQGIGVHAQSNNMKSSTANILLLNKYNSHAQAKVNLLRAVVTHATKKENEWTLFYQDGSTYKTCTLSSSLKTATPISPENKCVQFIKQYASTERIAELKVIRKKKNQTEYVNTTFKFTTKGTENNVLKTPTVKKVTNVSSTSDLANVEYVNIPNSDGIPIQKPKKQIVSGIEQPNPQYGSSQNYRLIAKCDTLRIWIRPNSPTPRDKDLEDFCWNYYISNMNGATPNPISKLDKQTLYDVVFANIIDDANVNIRGVYKRENQTVWIHCKEQENCIDTPIERAVVQYILFHEVHHLRQHILLCGKNSEKCFRSFYDEYQGLLEGGARYEEYRRETKFIENANIPEASKNESCITKWTQDDYDCAGFVIAKLHQLYELNKKPGKPSIPYMDIFILQKMKKTREKSLEKAITRIFKEDTNLKYDVKLSDIEKKVAKAMNLIIKNEKNATKKAEKICAHPDLPNYYPYLSYCPTKK